jgi:peptide-methionine (S)-S-oxide reductase
MNTQRAVLAGGCFWGMQELFRHLPGVVKTTVGYTGGELPNPTYDDMKAKNNGHAEAVEIVFDPVTLSYRQLLEFMFQIHDPTTANRQGNDIGGSYRSAIFYADEVQKKEAEKLIAEMNTSGKWPGRIVTEVVPAKTFYTAEDYHQDYLVDNPNGYTCHYIRPDWKLS